MSYILGPAASNGAPAQEQLTALDWDGTSSPSSARRAIVFTAGTSGLLAATPATYLWKSYPRTQVSGVGDGTRYWTHFFWGNNGRFDYDSGAGDTWIDSYYGFHPYPRPPEPPSPGDGRWEISADANDWTDRDDASSPDIVVNQWYSHAAVLGNSGGNRQRKFYINLPNVTTQWTITHNVTGAHLTPPSPCLIWGQAPDFTGGTNESGQSWGGYSGRYEEGNNRLRGFQVYTTALSEAHAVALAAKERNAEVLAYCAANGLSSSLWYLNMNPTVADISDKSGAGHHPQWVGSDRPADFTL